MFNFAGSSIEDEEAGLIALWNRSLSDQFRRQDVIKIRRKHDWETWNKRGRTPRENCTEPVNNLGITRLRLGITFALTKVERCGIDWVDMGE